MVTVSFRWGAIGSALILLVVAAAAPGSAQNLAVIQARSLNDALEGVEAVSEAAGQAVDREALMGQVSGMLGVEPGEFLDLERPVAVVMPVQGMMLQQNGLVAAVPVTDVVTAIEAVSGIFEEHDVEDDVHVFSRQGIPVLFLVEAGDYLRIGGNRSLVSGFDPLAGEQPGADVVLEIFLEPVAPMIAAGLEAGKAQVRKELQTDAAADEELEIDPEAMASMLDLYFDGIQSLVSNTSSLRMLFDVDDGHLMSVFSLIAKEESALASFIAAQKGGLPEIAKLGDPGSAVFMAGRITLDDAHRQGLKDLTARYADVMVDLMESEAATGATDEAASDADDGAVDPTATLWADYMDWMGQVSDRWIDCTRGDMVVSMDFRPERPLSFVEAFGMRDLEGCDTVVADMVQQLDGWLETNHDLASVLTFEDGPSVAGSKATLVSFDVVKWMEALGSPSDPEVDEVIGKLYGERMDIAMAPVGDVVVVTGGDTAVERLQSTVATLGRPGPEPSFSPLEVGPGMWMTLDLGRMMSWMKGAMPDQELDLDGPASALSGDAGRIPMGIRFAGNAASFEMAVSMETIGAFAALAEQERAEAAAEAAVPEPVPEEEHPG